MASYSTAMKYRCIGCYHHGACQSRTITTHPRSNLTNNLAAGSITQKSLAAYSSIVLCRIRRRPLVTENFTSCSRLYVHVPKFFSCTHLFLQCVYLENARNASSSSAHFFRELESRSYQPTEATSYELDLTSSFHCLLSLDLIQGLLQG